jgi:transposase
VAEVHTLRERLAKDSHNSSKPPSSDGLASKTKSLRKKTGRKPGGQPGHRGHQVRLVQTPDTVVVHRPERFGTCAQALPEDAPSWVERRQVHELPPVRLHVTEHRLLHVRCPGCGTTVGKAPADVRAPRHYGPQLRAVATYLVAEVFGAPLSVGTLVSIVRQGAERLHDVEQEIKGALRQAPALHHDETGLRVVGPNGAGAGVQWTHVTCTKELTHYARHAARGAAALQVIGILPAFSGVSIHDGWTSYRHFTACRHALCNAHHLRELTFVEEELHQAWAGQLKHVLRQMRTAVEAAQAAGATYLDPRSATAWSPAMKCCSARGWRRTPSHPPP